MGISVPQLLTILLIVVLVFGTKRLRNIGSDLGSAIRGFKKGMQEDDKPPERLSDESRENDTAARAEDKSRQ